MIKEALYYEKIDKDTVMCKLCPHFCKITCGNSGLCIPRKAVRNENKDTILINTNFEAITSIAIDQIEKLNYVYIVNVSEEERKYIISNN
ncbi:MAG: hypothetical protein ACRDA3_04595 [Peptostreptococcaceae bacterium]